MTDSTTPGTGESVITRIVDGLAEETGKDACEIAPLHESVDGDALEAIVCRANPGLIVEFMHAGQDIRVEKTPDLQVTIG